MSKPLLERVFPIIYGVKLKEVLTHGDLAVGSYRFAVSRLIPETTQVALRTHKKYIMRETPGFAKRKFLYRLSRSEYEKEWGKGLPKAETLYAHASNRLAIHSEDRAIQGHGFNNQTPQTAEMYFKSVNTTVDQYKLFLEEVRTDSLVLPNRDFDTGNATKAAEYTLTDGTYAQLLFQLTDRRFNLTTADPREDILEFYSDLSAQFETKKDQARWQRVLKSLDQLKSLTPNATVADSPVQRSLSVPKARGLVADGGS